MRFVYFCSCIHIIYIYYYKLLYYFLVKHNYVYYYVVSDLKIHNILDDVFENENTISENKNTK